MLALINPTDYWSTARSGGRDGLGIIATNPEINRTLRGPGILPNDRDLSRHRNYLPLHHGWIIGQNKTYWHGNLGQSEDDFERKAVEDLVKAEKIKAWMAVLGTASSIAVAVMLGFQLSKR
jgi:hypothetical protein